MGRFHLKAFAWQVNLDRRGVLAAFKSKSLDLLGTSRILLPQPQPQSHAHRHAGRMTDDHSPGRNAAAERRRRLFRRKKANSASASYDESPSGSPQSRSSSLESNSAVHTIHRGLESALKASTLFAWSSIEASSCTAHLLAQANQPSFIERESRSLHCLVGAFRRRQMTRSVRSGALCPVRRPVAQRSQEKEAHITSRMK